MNLWDVIVIGGGMAGISAAAELAEGARVIVLEREDVTGYHSTGRSAAMLVRNYGNATLKALNHAAAPYLEAPEGVSDTSLLSPRGELVIADADELPALETYLSEARGVERLTAAEAVAMVPILRPDRVVAAAIEPDAQDIDVDRMLQGYIRLLRTRGGKIVTGAAAQVIARVGDVWQVDTGSAQYQAPVLVNAAGAWADQVAGLAGVRPVGLTPLRRSAAIIPAPGGHDVSRWPLIMPAGEAWYAKPEAGKLLVSPADEDPVDPHDAWPDDMVLAEGIDRFQQAVTTEVTRVERSWAGLRTFAPDRSPVVGFDAAAPGFFWLAGQGGYGIQTAPALSRLAAALCSGADPALPAEITEALSPARFSGS